MAIDYKKEWEKLQRAHGKRTMSVGGSRSLLSAVMHNQINDTIENREKLMDEYVKTRVQTEIIGGDTLCHKVKLTVVEEPRGTIWISKTGFDQWCEKKGGK